MSLSYFCFGTALNAMSNFETYVQEPHVLPQYGGMPMPLLGGSARRTLNGRLRRGGHANGALMLDVDTQARLNTLLYALYGDLTTASKQLYVITRDAQLNYSPFLCYVDCPYLGSSQSLALGGVPTAIRFDLIGGVLQVATKTSNYTVTTSDHLLYATTSGGSVTFTLPALAGVIASIPYRFVKLSAANSMILDGDGAETINNAATYTATAQYASVTIIKSDSAWVTI